MGLAAAGAYGSAWIADKIKSSRDGNKSSDAVDGMNRIAPKVVAASAAHALPGVAVMGPGAVTAAAQRVGVAIQTARHGDKIVKGATHAAQFAEPFIVPGPPVALSIPGGAGAIVNEAIKEYQNSKR